MAWVGADTVTKVVIISTSVGPDGHQETGGHHLVIAPGGLVTGLAQAGPDRGLAQV
jgi:hypothetical protein